MKKQQSEASKIIKRLNQQMIDLQKLEPYNSPSLVKYVQLLNTKGYDIKYVDSKQTGTKILQIRNTKANQAKIAKTSYNSIKQALSNVGAKTAGERKREIKKQSGVKTHKTLDNKIFLKNISEQLKGEIDVNYAVFGLETTTRQELKQKQSPEYVLQRELLEEMDKIKAIDINKLTEKQKKEIQKRIEELIKRLKQMRGDTTLDEINKGLNLQ